MLQVQSLQCDPQSLLNEFEQIETAIADCGRVLQTLQARHAYILPVLDLATQPMAPRAPLTQRGFEFRDRVVHTRRFIDLYVFFLREIFEAYPHSREEFALAVARLGHSRRYIAKNRMELFSSKDASWVDQHSIKLVDGWYVDTNLSQKSMAGLIREVIRVAGLVPIRDFQIFWTARER